MNTVLIALLVAAINNAQMVAGLVADAANGKQHTPEDLDALTASIADQSAQIQKLRTPPVA